MTERGSYPTDWDVEQYRHPWDSDDQWDLRRQFILAQKDSGLYAEDMLVCWAQVFANVEILGTKYPDEVMAQVKELSEGIDCEYTKRREARLKVAFVKAAEKEDSNKRGRDQGSDYPPEKKAHWERPAESNQPGNRPAASSYFQSPAQAPPQHIGYATANKYMTQNYYSSRSGGGGGGGGGDAAAAVEGNWGGSNNTRGGRAGQGQGKKTGDSPVDLLKVEPDEQLAALQNKLTALATAVKGNDSTKPVPETFHQCTQKAQIRCEKTFAEETGGGWTCSLVLSGVRVAAGAGQNKKAALATALDAAVALLRAGNGVAVARDPSHGFVLREGVVASLGGVTASCQATAIKDKVLQNFVLVQRRHQTDYFSAHPLSALNQAASFNKRNLEYVTSMANDAVRCVVLLDGVAIGESEGTGHSIKVAAAVAALEYMRTVCQTLLIDNVASADSGLSKEELCLQGRSGGSATSDDAAIPDDNVGNKLLRMMGWSGGGLGKEGRKGIAEPIKAVQTFKRQGLGLSEDLGITPKFIARIHQIMRDYVRSQSRDDLVFTSEFSKEERAKMHSIAQTYRLKSTSYGKGDDRHLVVCRKMAVKQLVQHVQGHGGQTGRYELLPPTQSSSSST